MEQVKQRRTIVRTSAGIRDALIDQMERIINEETDAKTANAFARLSGEIVRTVEMELKVEEFRSKVPGPKPAEAGQKSLPSFSLGSKPTRRSEDEAA